METSSLESTLNTRAVKELRSILASRNVDYSECIEKSELVAKVISTMEKEPLVQNSVMIGQLDCTVIQNAKSNFDAIIVFIHGYGANAADLTNIAHKTIIPEVKSKIKIVYPNAPLKLGANSFAWWHIDLQKYIVLGTSGPDGIEKIANDVPDGFLSASELVQNLLKDLSLLYNVPMNKIVIGGFSQGAMLSCEIGLKLDVAGVVAWSAGMLNGAEWKKLAQEKKLKVFQTHGTEDAIIPFVLGSKVKTDVFEAFQHDHTFVSFKGGHQLPPEVLQKSLDFLKTILGE